MKRILLLFIIFPILFSCSKHTEQPVPQQATGVLLYSDPASDGPGLYFLTDGNSELLYFYNEMGDQFSNVAGFKDSIGLHLRMTYLDQGRRGCPFCQFTPAHQERIVKLLRLTRP
jgi:hypothetical protein